MIALLPEWIVVLMTMLALAIFVTGRVRIAALLAMPALLRFVIWPALVNLFGGFAVVILVIVSALALPIVFMRAARRLLILLIGANAADLAIGRTVGEGLIRLAGWRKRSSKD